jgi:hypothetical protein
VGDYTEKLLESLLLWSEQTPDGVEYWGSLGRSDPAPTTFYKPSKFPNMIIPIFLYIWGFFVPEQQAGGVEVRSSVRSPPIKECWHLMGGCLSAGRGIRLASSAISGKN